MMEGNKGPGDALYDRACASLAASGMDAGRIRREWFWPQPHLVICGGGHVGCELARMAAGLDMRVRVLDDRAEFACRERFPQAEDVICDSFENLEAHLIPDAFYVVATRGHKDDFACVKAILPTPHRYLGMIGSKGKVANVMENLLRAGFTQEQAEGIFAPIGLKIHAVTPAEIAISILAEIIREKNREHGASVSRELLKVQEAGVLCIITDKRGSSPRGVGSMMFVTADRVIDSIGGGPVEFAAIRDAREITAVTEKTYHLNHEDGGALGMVCGGSNRVLFIPI